MATIFEKKEKKGGTAVDVDKVRFRLGNIYVTPGVMATFCSQFAAACFLRHASGDWGDLDEFDKRQNEQALLSGDRLLSAYVDAKRRKLWVITEADRSSTTILLPDEY